MSADGTNFCRLADQVKVKLCPAVPVPAVMMLPAAVQVQVEPAAEIIVKVQAPVAVALQPTGTVNPVIAPAPLTMKYGPLGVIVPAAAGTVAVWAVKSRASGLLNPATQVLVTEEHSH